MTTTGHRRAALVFVALSGADLFLTWELLRHPGGDHYEANWLASSVLANFDFAGLAAFKALTVLAVGLVVYLVARSRPNTARRLATFACLAVGAVVLYSTALLARQAAQPNRPRVKDEFTLRREEASLNQTASCHAAFSAKLTRWRTAVATGRGTLDEALRELSASDLAPWFARAVRNPFGSPGMTDTECLAALVMRGAVSELREDGSAAAWARAGRLMAAYRAQYGSGLAAYVLEEYPDADKARLEGLANPVRVAEAVSRRRSPAGGGSPQRPGCQRHPRGDGSGTRLAWRGAGPHRQFGWGARLAWRGFKSSPYSPRPRGSARGWGARFGAQAQARLAPRSNLPPR